MFEHMEPSEFIAGLSVTLFRRKRVTNVTGSLYFLGSDHNLF